MVFTVQSTTGELIAGAVVTIGSTAVTTGSAGTAEFTNLTSGTSYTATITASGYTDGTKTFTVSDSETTQIVTLATATSAVVAAVASEAIVAGQTYVEQLLAKVDAKIASSHSWEKAGWIVLRALVVAGQSWAIAAVEKKLG